MTDNLTNELLQLQKSRCGFKYADMVDDYVRDIPGRLTKNMNRPLSSINKNIAILSRYRGLMAYNLEKKFFSSIRKLKRLTNR